MRRAVWILLSLAVIAALTPLWWGDDLAPPPSPTVGPVAEAATTEAAGATVVTDSIGTGVDERRAVAAELSEYEQLLASVATGYTGRVVSAAGEPVPGIGVSLLRVAATAALPFDMDVFARTPSSPRLLVAETTTDRAGRFALTGIAPRGLCFLRLTFADVEAAAPRFRAGNGTTVPVQQTPPPGEVIDLGDVQLKTGATLVGRVVDLDGPVAGALVRAARLPPLPFGAVPIERLRPDGALIGTPGGEKVVVEIPEWVGELLEVLPIAVTTSRADGTFTLHGVDPGSVVVAATAPSHASCLRQGVACAAGQVVTLGDLFLAYGSTTEVHVVDEADEPVAGARVFVAPMSVGIPAHVAEPAGVTDDEGIAYVEGLPTGRAIAAAQRSGDTAWHVGEPASAEGRLRIVIPGRHSLTLKVQDSVGAAVPNPRVRLIAGSRNHGMLELALFGARQPAELGRRLQRLEDGRFRIVDLDAGTWTLAIGAQGYATQTAEFDLTENIERVVELRGARELRVRTIDAAGEPVADATLYARSRGGSRAQRIVELPLAVGRTNDDGWCCVPDLPTDQTRLTAMHPRLGQVHAEIRGQPQELVMQFAMPASIHGVLTDGGRPPAPGRWVLVLERRYGDGPLRRGAMPEMPQLAMPDLEGNFRFPALQPGKWRVTSQDSVTDVSTVAGFFEYRARKKKIFPWNKAEVTLQGGEDVEVRLDAIVDAAPFEGPGATVRGTVVVNGMPAVGAIVVGTSTKPNRRVTNRVDRGGGFDLGRAPAGKLRVVVVAADVADSRLREHLYLHLYARNIQIEPERPVDLTIDIRVGSAFGEVRGGSGSPVANCRVMLYDKGGEGRSSSLRTLRADSRGAFEFVDIPQGLYELRADKERFGTATLPGIRITSGGTTGPIDVTLTRIANVAGRVVFGVPVPPKRRALLLHPIAGGKTLRTAVREDGQFRVRSAPVGRYRAEVQMLDGPMPAGEIEVIAPVTKDVVLNIR